MFIASKPISSGSVRKSGMAIKRCLERRPPFRTEQICWVASGYKHRTPPEWRKNCWRSKSLKCIPLSESLMVFCKRLFSY